MATTILKYYISLPSHLHCPQEDKKQKNKNEYLIDMLEFVITRTNNMKYDHLKEI